jgi:hypothetical protein
MAGPIRDLLARQPVRNAVRTLLGMPTRYGMMGDRLESAAATDAMQGADVMARPTRLMRRNILNPQVSAGTTGMSIAPSPEAQAVASAREQDSQRRLFKRRASELGAPSQPQKNSSQPLTEPVSAPAPVTEVAGGRIPEQSPTPAAEPADFRMSRIEQLRQRAEQLRAEAGNFERMPGFATNAGTQLQFQQRLLQAQADENRADELLAQRQQEDFAVRNQGVAHTQDLARLAITNPPDTLKSNANDFRETVRTMGIAAAAAIMADTAAANMQTLDATEKEKWRLQYGTLASGIALAERLAARNPPVDGDPMLTEITSIVNAQAPADPRARAALVSRIVGIAQQNSPGLTSQQAAAMARALTTKIEEQIAAQKPPTLYERYIGSDR